MKPTRVQLSRKKGWKMPPNTVKVDRTTEWGNPFKPETWIGNPGAACAAAIVGPEEAIAYFRLYLSMRPLMRKMIRMDLKGKNLACWCQPGEPCHADVLLEIANDPAK